MHFEREVELLQRAEREATRAQRLSFFVAILGIITALVGAYASGQDLVNNAVQHALHPQVSPVVWFRAVDWKHLALVVGGTIVTIFGVAKLILETIKAWFDVRDRMRGGPPRT